MKPFFPLWWKVLCATDCNRSPKHDPSIPILNISKGVLFMTFCSLFSPNVTLFTAAKSSELCSKWINAFRLFLYKDTGKDFFPWSLISVNDVWQCFTGFDWCFSFTSSSARKLSHIFATFFFIFRKPSNFFWKSGL